MTIVESLVARRIVDKDKGIPHTDGLGNDLLNISMEK